MDLTATTLPDDIDALKAMVLAREEDVAALQERLSSRETEIGAALRARAISAF